MRFEIEFSGLKMMEFQYDKEDIHFTVKRLLLSMICLILKRTDF